MLKFTCCPNFSVFSFIFYITVIDIIIYLVTVIISMASSSYSLNSSQFLGPDIKLLKSFGAQVPSDIRYQGQVYRLILPVFLHAGFLHIFSNMVSQMILGFMLESLLGQVRVASIYFASGIGGNIFSALCNPGKDSSVGASTALFGFVGTLIAVVVVNWKAFDRSPELRCFMIIMITFILLFSLISILGDTSDTQS
jgi:membrane associated rhomboid family serine protease